MGKGKEIQQSSQSSNNLVRIDKNIANNSEALDLDFQSNDELVSSILMYAAYQRKNHLFDFGIIDPEDFARTMGFAPKYLTSVHPKPACLEGYSADQIAKAYHDQEAHPEDPHYRIFDSRLENALFLLLSKNMTFRRTGIVYKEKDGSSMQRMTVTSVRLLKSFSIIFRKSPRGKKKLFYDYELDEGFGQNLSLLYITANIDDFTMLRKKSLHKLYLYVKNLRDNAIALYLKDLKENISQKEKQDYFIAEFDLLCRITGIGSNNARDKKSRLVKAFAELKKVLPIELTWTRREKERWEYVPVIVFMEIRNTDKLIPADKSDPIGEKVDIFTLNLMIHVISEYKEEYGYELGREKDVRLLEGFVLSFLKKKEKDLIRAWYMKAQVETFTFCNSKSNENFEIFYKNLDSLNSYNDIKSFLLTLFQQGQQHWIVSRSVEDLKREFKEVSFVEAAITAAFEEKLKADGYKLVNIGGKFYSCR